MGCLAAWVQQGRHAVAGGLAGSLADVLKAEVCGASMSLRLPCYTQLSEAPGGGREACSQEACCVPLHTHGHDALRGMH